MLRPASFVVMSAIAAATWLMACASEPATAFGTTVDFRPAGAACAFDTQCKSGFCSGDASTGSCGRCLEVRGLGQACDAPNVTCNRWAGCHVGTCRSTGKTAGEACEIGPKGESGDCDDELYCAGEAGQTGRCTPRPNVGEPCAFGIPCNGRADCEGGICLAAALGGLGEPCDERPCQSSLVCRGTETGLTCEEPIVIHEGAPCGYDHDHYLGDCEAGTACELTGDGNADDGDELVCMAGVGRGESCASAHCTPGLACGEDRGQHAFTCQPPRNEGESCYGYPCAAGLECRHEICEAACR
jgi:hypothetical protein